MTRTARWELWMSPDDTGHTFFREENAPAGEMAVADGFTLAWTVDAVGVIAAMTALHEHLGYEPYQPMLREDGTPYPDDEVDVL